MEDLGGNEGLNRQEPRQETMNVEENNNLTFDEAVVFTTDEWFVFSHSTANCSAVEL